MRTFRSAPWLGIVFSLASACGDERVGDGVYGDASGIGSDADGTGGEADAGDGDASGDGDGEDDGPRLDVEGDGDGDPGCDGPDGECGCNAVDILFVIDNSTSMGSYQQALAAVAPAFADAITDTLPPGVDLHVGVTTSSFYGGSGGTSPGEADCEPYYEGAGLSGRDDLYMWYWTPDAMPYAENGAQGRLRVHEDKTYFAVHTDEDTSAMKDWLVGNIRAVGENGSVWEMVAAATAYPFHAANAAHNQGFLRDEGAVLVIFALTDEVDNSPESVAAYHDMIVAAKQGCGGDKCVVTAGVMKPCLETAQDQVLYPLLASFGKAPILADIGPELDDCFDDCEKGDITECDLVNPPVTCEELAMGKGTAQYADALGSALADVIAQTCEEIPPEG